MANIRGKNWLAVGLAVAVLVGVGACSTGGDGDRMTAKTVTESSDDAGLALSRSAMTEGSGGPVAAGAPAASNVADTAALPASVSQPRIVKNATVHVEVGDGKFGSAFSEVARIATGAGGFVASSTSAASDGELASGSLTVRVPAERFDDVRLQIRDLGKLKSEELRGDDVGGQLTDLEARLRNLRAQEEAIRVLMAKTTNVQETLQIQNQLSGVREQIEQLDAQRARLDDAVTFATLTVQLTEPGVAPAGDRSRLGEALDTAIDGAESMLAGAIVAIGYFLPVVLLALIAFGLFRAVTRPRRGVPVVATPSAEHGA